MSNPNVKFNPNPNFKEDVMKAAQEKLSSAVAPAKAVLMTDKEALQALQRNERLGSRILENLWQKGLIQVLDVSTQDTPAEQRELVFTFFTEEGKKLLES